MQLFAEAQQRFAEVSQQLEQFARNTFAEAAKRARTDLQSRIQDVQAARTRSTQDAQLKVKDLQSRLQQLKVVMELLCQINPRRTTSRRGQPA